MSDDKPVVEIGITDIDSVWLEPGPMGGLRVLFCTDQPQELALRIPPSVLVKLETKLAEARDAQGRLIGRH